MTRVIKHYFALCMKWNIAFDIGLAIVFTYSVVDNTYIVEPKKMVANIMDWIKILIPALTFQAGIHTTSLSFFANSNSPILERLRQEFVEINGVPTKYKAIEQIFAYFSWAILVQLIMLLTCVMSAFYISSQDLNTYQYTKTICWYYFIIWGTIYAIILTLRNLNLLLSSLIVGVRKAK